MSENTNGSGAVTGRGGPHTLSEFAATFYVGYLVVLVATCSAGWSLVQEWFTYILLLCAIGVLISMRHRVDARPGASRGSRRRWTAAGTDILWLAMSLAGLAGQMLVSLTIERQIDLAYLELIAIAVSSAAHRAAAATEASAHDGT